MITTVDLAYAYGQLMLAKETARQCNSSVVEGKATGTHQCQTGFHGLTDIPAEFPQARDRTLGKQPGVFEFEDHVLIASKEPPEEHQNPVRKTLKRMDQEEMASKLEKCTFESYFSKTERAW